MGRRGKEVNKAIILHTATELIARNGFEGVSMDAIAAGSEITKRTLYKYFPSKMAILLNIFEQNLRAIHEMSVFRVARNLPLADYLKTNLRELYEYSVAHESFMKLFWTLDVDALAAEHLPIAKEHIRVWNSSIGGVSAEYIRRAGPTGWLAGFAPEEIQNMVSAMNKGIVLQTAKDRNLNMQRIESMRLLYLFQGLLDLALRDGFVPPPEFEAFMAAAPEK